LTRQAAGDHGRDSDAIRARRFSTWLDARNTRL